MGALPGKQGRRIKLSHIKYIAGRRIKLSHIKVTGLPTVPSQVDQRQRRSSAAVRLHGGGEGKRDLRGQQPSAWRPAGRRSTGLPFPSHLSTDMLLTEITPKFR